MSAWEDSLYPTQATSLVAAAQHVVMALYGDNRREHVLRAGALCHNAWESGGALRRAEQFEAPLLCALRDLGRAMTTGDPVYARLAEEALQRFFEETLEAPPFRAPE